MEYIQVITVAGSEEEAERISKAVVENRLAACAQILGPISSIYHWKGKMERAKEWLCLLKSRNDNYKELEKLICQLHSYEEQEILAVPVVKGSKSYLRWVKRELKQG